MTFDLVWRHIAQATRHHVVELNLEGAGSILVFVGPLKPTRHGKCGERLYIILCQSGNRSSRCLKLCPGFLVGFLDACMMVSGLYANLHFDKLFHLRGKIIPVFHANRQIHQIDWLVQ